MDRLVISVLALLVTSPGHAESLTFTIYALHGAERELLEADRRDYLIDDIKVVTDRDESGCKGCSRRSLALADGFRIGVYVVPDGIYKGTIGGFGMWIDRDGDTDGFSWCWFEPEGNMIFNRGKGGSRIRVKVEPYGELVRVSSIEFLDDIEITYSEDIRGKQPGERSHLVVVSRGSVLTLSR